jgi:GNAT superfamily N-acetyltransferase
LIQEIHAPSSHLAYKAMLELRPNIGPEQAFTEQVDGVLRPEGYRLVGFFVKDDLYAAAVTGFRLVHHLAWGHVLYCDDLSTRYEHRKQGYAAQLMDWMIDEAKRLHLDEFHLDSGVGPDRTDAHRLYFNKRMRISAHHFSRPV